MSHPQQQAERRSRTQSAEYENTINILKRWVGSRVDVFVCTGRSSKFVEQVIIDDVFDDGSYNTKNLGNIFSITSRSARDVKYLGSQAIYI